MLELPASTEQDKVEVWRLHVLEGAGYPTPLARQIASSGADLHRAVELVEAGCPFELAGAILL